MNWKLWVSVPLLASIWSCHSSGNQDPVALSQPATPSPTSFSSRHVVVISDLHFGLGKDEKTDRWHPMEDFRWPRQFGLFLERIDHDGKGNTDLIINGDMFELWQSRLDDCQDNRAKDLGCTEEESLRRLQHVVNFHHGELQALGSFAKRGNNRLIIIPGNHDAALLFPTVKEAVLKAIGGGQQVHISTNGYWLSADGLIYAEHGHQIGQEVNKWDQWPSPFLKENGKQYLQRPWGEKFVQDYYNRFEAQFPIIDNISPESEGVRYAMAAEGPFRTIKDIAGFLKFYLFGVSWSQFKASLGKEEKGAPPEWDIDAIRQQGPRFFAESLPTDHPFAADVREPKDDREKEQLSELFKSLSNGDIKAICDQRALLVALQLEKTPTKPPTITGCPQTTGDLGAITQALFRSGEKVLGEHLEKAVCQKLQGCAEKPFMVFIYSHTHLALPPKELTLSNGFWRPTRINTGAWQRVATPEEVESIKDQRRLPKKEVLPKLNPEDLPSCYSFVLIEPYPKGKQPVPLLRYWIGEEGQPGMIKNQCNR
ncbi:MAG: metallophosphoesterase [Nitrospira sp.]|nr:metallophosphoesterase [Nitrospira sp.]MCA9498569.1 metallophosphoesterase [Nitrospira sp.]